jgi:hypothetical protein
MSTNISPAELTLLQYLHDRAGVSGGRIALDPKAIKRGLRISATQLAEAAASLAAHGFAGVRHTRFGLNHVPVDTCSGIWVTSKGEAYLTRSCSAHAETASRPPSTRSRD